MARRGPKPQHDLGEGTITAKGYHRISREGRHVMAHVWAWEQVHGPVPDGYDLHHVDLNRLNNDLDNLQMLTRADHRRVHEGCERRDGVWWKPCRKCDVFKPLDQRHWHIGPRGRLRHGRCRSCQSHVRRLQRVRRRLRGPRRL